MENYDMYLPERCLSVTSDVFLLFLTRYGNTLS